MNTYISKVHEYKPSALQYLYTRYPNLDGINFNDLELLWKVENLWINFQKQFENNPPHTHTGDLSFVIYLQVPKELVEENKLHIQNHTQNNEGPGNIVFVYGEELFMNINCVTKFPKRGEIIIFPAWLNHHVLSFKSDVERISVSGNIQLDIIKKGD